MLCLYSGFFSVIKNIDFWPSYAQKTYFEITFFNILSPLDSFSQLIAITTGVGRYKEHFDQRKLKSDENPRNTDQKTPFLTCFLIYLTPQKILWPIS